MTSKEFLTLAYGTDYSSSSSSPREERLSRQQRILSRNDSSSLPLLDEDVYSSFHSYSGKYMHLEFLLSLINNSLKSDCFSAVRSQDIVFVVSRMR